MKRFRVLGIILMVAFTACGSNGAQQASAAPGGNGVSVTEQYEYYPIAGNTETDLRQQMTLNGIKWDDGKTYDALTTWNVKWNYDYNCGNLGCVAADFNATVAITFRYPAWQPTDQSPATLVQKWDAYMQNLIIHEVGHRDMAVEETQEMVAAISGLPPAPSRRELDRQIQAVTQTRMARLNDIERQYDADTIHGSTQGAVFP